MRRLVPSVHLRRLAKSRIIARPACAVSPHSRSFRTSAAHNLPRAATGSDGGRNPPQHSTPDPDPNPNASQFKDLILSIATPTGSKEIPRHLQQLQEAILAAFLPVNQHVESPSPVTAAKHGPSPFPMGPGSGPFPGGMIVHPFRAHATESDTAKEAVVALVSPFEGGRQYTFDAVKTVASSMEAEVLRFDLALGIGLNGSDFAFDQGELKHAWAYC